MRFATPSIILTNSGQLSNDTDVAVDIPGMIATFKDGQRFTFSAGIGVFINGVVSLLTIGIVFPAAPLEVFYSGFYTSPTNPNAICGAFATPTVDFPAAPSNVSGFYYFNISGRFRFDTGGDLKFTFAQVVNSPGQGVEILDGSCWMKCNPIS